MYTILYKNTIRINNKVWALGLSLVRVRVAGFEGFAMWMQFRGTTGPPRLGPGPAAVDAELLEALHHEGEVVEGHRHQGGRQVAEAPAASLPTSLRLGLGAGHVWIVLHMKFHFVLFRFIFVLHMNCGLFLFSASGFLAQFWLQFQL